MLSALSTETHGYSFEAFAEHTSFLRPATLNTAVENESIVRSSSPSSCCRYITYSRYSFHQYTSLIYHWRSTNAVKVFRKRNLKFKWEFRSKPLCFMREELTLLFKKNIANTKKFLVMKDRSHCNYVDKVHFSRFLTRRWHPQYQCPNSNCSDLRRKGRQRNNFYENLFSQTDPTMIFQ